VRAAALIVALVALVALGCGDREVSSCRDDLGGIWRDAQGRRYHLVEGSPIQIFPLFDSTAPPGNAPKASAAVHPAPFYIELHRRPTVVSGTRKQRFARGAIICHTRTRAELTRCKGRSLEIDIAEPEIHGWSAGACQWDPGPRTTLRLTR
jgi:hypothetical protein